MFVIIMKLMFYYNHVDIQDFAKNVLQKTKQITALYVKFHI